MRKTTYLLLSLIFAINILSGQQLVEIFQDAAGSHTGTTTWFDYDGDGDQDLLITGFNPTETNATVLYQNDGDGNFTIVDNTGFDNLAISSIAAADYNNDGAIDLFMMGSTMNDGVKSDIFTNNGDGTFTAMNGNFSKLYMGSCNWVDYNNDSFLDLFVTGYDDALSDYVSILYVNDQNGNFTPVSNTGIQGVSLSSSAWCDFDGDGWKDVFVSGMGMADPDIATIYKNNGDNTFSEMQSFTSVWCSDVALSDYDDDGDMDIIFSGYNTNSGSCLTFMMNNDGGTFSQVSDNIMGASHSGIAWGDYNMDGKDDLFITGAHEASINQMAKLYTHKEDNSFEDSNFFFTGVWWADAAWGDIDGDSDPDLVYIGKDAGGATQIFVYRNDVINGIDYSFSKEVIQVYPNPAHSTITINVFNSNFENASILNILGEKLWSKDNFITNQIDIENLDDGVYFLQLRKNGQTNTVRFIKH